LLLRDLLSYLGGGVERVLSPVVFANRTWRGGSGWRGDWCGFGFGLVTLLHEEEEAQSGCDEDYESGAHGPIQSTLYAMGTLLR
jgi:hypothetical protein